MQTDTLEAIKIIEDVAAKSDVLQERILAIQAEVGSSGQGRARSNV